MTSLVLFCAVALADDGPDDSAADSRFALSVGTGPRPLNFLTFGLSGLAARVAFPLGRAVPFASLALHSTSAADFEERQREDRYVTTLSSTHVSAGVRLDLDERRAKSVVPYVLGAALVGQAGGRSGQPIDQDWDRSSSFTIGVLGGFGLDGFVTRHLSLGAEIGGFGAISNGGSVFIDNGQVDEEYGDVDTTVLTTFTALQVTVWR